MFKFIGISRKYNPWYAYFFTFYMAAAERYSLM